MASDRVEFDLPDEILAVIPVDPYDQLDLARRITSMAISSRVSRLEGEAGLLRQKIVDRDRVIDELQDKVDHLDRLVQESHARLRATLEENATLSEERETLDMTSKKLARYLSKLETFKRHLVKSLSDDNLSQLSQVVDDGMYKQPIARISSWRDDGSISHVGSDVANGSAETGDSNQDGSKHFMHQFSITPYITPRPTPSRTPNFFLADDSPRGFSTTESSPRVLSEATSPSKPQLEGRGSMSHWYASSQQSSASCSPPHRQSMPGYAPRIIGKELFRQARSRLSYEQFAAFLTIVKEFNAQRQSRKETLAKAEEIFGTEHKDLYISFQSLLSRTIP
ncbi:hypothetical protein MUK42_24012 [Musa troglodytarum]|uniref:At4g15545-like C-terminal domain-containing protein n=1 Tax=Musa troglodytarum TaxID=320322 RepID=A0A9E7KE33_9LILI|nr:hypothetical protein MUK42_24012 [Musa troglodytarum]